MSVNKEQEAEAPVEVDPKQIKIQQYKDDLEQKINRSNNEIDEQELDILMDKIWDTYDQNGCDLLGPTELKDFLKDLLSNVIENRKVIR